MSGIKYAGYFVVIATHPKTPNHTRNSRGRSQHLASNSGKSTLTLCNLLVSFRWEGGPEPTKPCAVCWSKLRIPGTETRRGRLESVKNPTEKISYTLNTDASFSPKWKRASFAYWIKGSDFHVKGSGIFPRQVDTSAIAELMAFEKALQRINQKIPKEERKNVKLYLNTDCMFVIDVLSHNVLRSKKKLLIRAVQHAAKDYEIDARHVRAHTGDLSTARSYVNDWCDQTAKGELIKEGFLNEKKPRRVR